MAHLFRKLDGAYGATTDCRIKAVSQLPSSIPIRHKTALSYDESAALNMIRPAGVWASICHNTYLYQDGVAIGEYTDADMGHF